MTRFLLHRPVAVLITALALSVLGVVVFRLLPVSLLPDIPVPEITVQVSYPNAAARELQQAVVLPLKNQLLQVNHLEDIEATTQDGFSVLKLRFDFGTDVRLAYLETNEKIDGILSQFPRDMERPKVIKAGAGDIAVFQLNVSPKRNQTLRGEVELSDFCQNVLKRRIEQLPEVALVDATGLALPEVVVSADRNKMQSLGISENQIAELLRQNNVNLGNVVVKDGQYQYNIRFSSVLRTPQDIESITFWVGGSGRSVGTQNSEGERAVRTQPLAGIQNSAANERPTLATGRLMRLGELVKVSIQEQQQRGLYTFNGQRAVGLAIIKQSDAQLLQMRTQLDQLLTQFRNDYPELAFTLSQDQTELLDVSINNLVSNILTGALLTFVMIFFFLPNPRVPVLIGIVIPVSLSITFLGFYLLGLSINIVSLAGLVLGIGEIIDSAIILIENIEEKREKGLSLDEACVEGTEEVIRPLFTSVLTNSAVFLPLVFLSGLAGALFFDQAVSVSLALAVSLLTSYTLIPVLYRLAFLKSKKEGPQMAKETWLMRRIEKVYNRTFDVAFRFRKGAWVLVVALLGSAVWAVQGLEKRGMPAISRSELEVKIDWNEPLSVSQNEQRIAQLLKTLSPAPLYVSAYVGQQQFVLNQQLQQSFSQATLSLKVADHPSYQRLSSQFSTKIRQAYPNAVVEVRPARNVFEQLFGTQQPPLQIRLFSTQNQDVPTPQQATETLRRLEEKGFKTNPIGYQKRLAVSLREEQLLLYGVTAEQTYQSLKTLFNENQIGQLQSEQKFVPIVLATQHPTGVQSVLQTAFVPNRQNQLIPLRELVEMHSIDDYRLFHTGKDGAYLPVDLEVENKQTAAFLPEIEKILKQDATLNYRLVGDYFRNIGYLEELAWVLLIAVALLFCILTAQFESLLQPLIVMLTALLGIAGALLTLVLFGESLNALSVIGLVVLIGLIDNDSILKIDTMNRERERLGIIEAIRLSGKRRLKSQLMTYLTTILGLLPVLFSGGLGAELQRPLAFTVIGGMTVGVIASWTLIPLLYYWIARPKRQ
ncbi:efflux RND transporter permease subunit [Runella slithyformis]|uniref:Acriflavin resistance protein n=1 Tax=Runella slithyformis (strain ATCC 29530 / DSM 19594 / LMG 11500 / NCIMB 11436 / LSU 4) TaxID=761193 RepID=A0A7U4E6V1_RUNSL|nr:efflux RND transporter permease subunit [Runella slithyformis]AEI49648.1 acriflavin resistance protein [Runella slithyformis DSM 19594]